MNKRTFVAWIVHEELKVPHHDPMAHDEVNFAGEPVAVVLATDRYKAQDAIEFIEVEYEPMDVVTDLEEAVAEGSPLAHEDFGTNEAYTWDLDSGDIDEAFSKADVTVKGRYLQPRLIPNAIETRGVVANPDPDQRRVHGLHLDADTAHHQGRALLLLRGTGAAAAGSRA